MSYRFCCLILVFTLGGSGCVDPRSQVWVYDNVRFIVKGNVVASTTIFCDEDLEPVFFALRQNRTKGYSSREISLDEIKAMATEKDESESELDDNYYAGHVCFYVVEGKLSQIQAHETRFALAPKRNIDPLVLPATSRELKKVFGKPKEVIYSD